MRNFKRVIFIQCLVITIATLLTGCSSQAKEIDGINNTLKEQEKKLEKMQADINSKEKELQNKEQELKNKEQEIVQLESKVNEKPKVIQSESDIREEIGELKLIQEDLGKYYNFLSKSREDSSEKVEYDYEELKSYYINVINTIDDQRYNYIVQIIKYRENGVYDNNDELFKEKQLIAEEIEKNCFYIETMYYLDGLKKGYDLNENITARNVVKRNVFDEKEFMRCEKHFLEKDKSLSKIFSKYND